MAWEYIMNTASDLVYAMCYLMIVNLHIVSLLQNLLMLRYCLFCAMRMVPSG